MGFQNIQVQIATILCDTQQYTVEK